MADDAHEERLRQHEAMLQGLARMFAAQHEMNQRLTAAIERIDRTFAQQAEFNGDVRTTLARLETLVPLAAAPLSSRPLAAVTRPGDAGLRPPAAGAWAWRGMGPVARRRPGGRRKARRRQAPAAGRQGGTRGATRTVEKAV